jgi:hypothetical protein
MYIHEFDLLLLLCSVNGVPLPRCQNKVFDAFLVKNRDALPTVKYVKSQRDTRREEPTFSMPNSDSHSGFDFIPVTDFLHQSEV